MIDRAHALASPAPAEAASDLIAVTRRRTLSRLRLVMWLSLLLPAVFCAAFGAWLYRQAFIDAQLALDRAARIAAEHALKLFDTNEMLLQRMLDLVGDANDAALLARSDDIHATLKRMAAGLPQVQGLYINGSDGRALGMSVRHPPPREIDYTDREWYLWHRGGHGDGVFFTEQLISRSTGDPFFDMNRRRNLADGSFGGTVHASLRPTYLTDFYQELVKIGPALRFTLVRADGKLVARWPGAVEPGAAMSLDHPIMLAVANGAGSATIERAVSAFDGVEQMAEIRRLAPYPLFVIASIPRGEVVFGWARRAALLGMLAAALAAGFAVMAWHARSRTRDELDALQRLDAETAHRQKIELALLQSQKLEAMGRLTGGVAHDFNNVLMIVATNLHLLRRMAPQTADSAQLSAMERAVASGTKLTRQLLSFARKQALRPQRMDLSEKLPELLNLLRPVLGARIEVSGAVALDTGEIEVDPAELELALINLALNAKDAMPSGGRLVVSARNALPGEAPASGAAFVVIEVCDTGTGIDETLLGRVFDAFFTTKPVGYGTGLGLSQVQALAASAGGIARIENAPGGGACVRLVLRRSTGQGDATPVSAGEEAMPDKLECRLMLVEDNDAVARATIELLSALGCTVRHFSEAKTAFAAMERDPQAFDIVLSDVEMPGMDGIEFATRLRKRWPRLPVLLMTGYASRLEEATRAQLDVLPKPCSPTVLANVIAKLLAHHIPENSSHAN